MFNYLKQGILFIIFGATLSGCTNKTSTDNTDTLNKYSLFLIDKDGTEFIVETNNLKEGSINPAKQNIKADTQDAQREMIVSNGYYYKLNYKTHKFSQYKKNGKLLEQAGSVELKNFFISNYKWISKDTLLLFNATLDQHKANIRYIKINVSNMDTSQGTVQIPYIPNNAEAVSIGFSEIHNHKLLLGYTYHIKEEEGYKATDTTYIAVLNYPSMQLSEIQKDARSTNSGGENTVEPGTFTDENGDFYYLTCPGVALGNSPDNPTALFRIKKNETKPDTSYFFNISASSINNHAYSIYYLGNQKAIIRNERKDLFSKWDEHWKVPHFEFYLIDLKTQEVSKLQLPLDKGTRRQCVLQDGDTVYISVNSSKEGNFIWMYDLKTGSLTKGLQLTGPTDYILRMDKLN